MKKITLFTLLLIALVLNSNLLAQNHSKKTIKEVNKASELFCTCINDFMGNLDPSLTKLTKDISVYGEEKAQSMFQEYLMTLPESRLLQIIDDANKMADIADDNLVSNCGLNNYEKYINNPEYNDLMIDYFSKNKKCEISRIFYNLGSE